MHCDHHRDEPKRLANLAKHGLDFADLTEEFFADALVVPAKKSRYSAIGRHSSGVLVVIFATLGREGISIISMRRANKQERSLFNG